MPSIKLLSLSAMDSRGYFPPKPGQILNGHYQVVRLLGYGRYSSTALVNDTSAPYPEGFKAVKILTAHATTLNKRGPLHEVAVLKKIAAEDQAKVLPILEDTFGISGPHGSHIALVLPVLTTDIGDFRKNAPNQRLPLHTVREAIYSVLAALVQLHTLGIIHTDVQEDNVMFNTPGPTIDKADRRLKLPDGNVQLGGKTYPVLFPKPLQHGFEWDDNDFQRELYDIVLNDFGHARFQSDPQDYVFGGPRSIQPPEVIVKARYDCKIDVWAVGCLTFQLLTGRHAFKPDVLQTPYTVDEHLSRISELTGKSMPCDLLPQGKKSSAPVHLATGAVALEERLRRESDLSEKDITSTAEFLHACFSLDPATRPSAIELVVHPWVLCVEESYNPNLNSYPATTSNGFH